MISIYMKKEAYEEIKKHLMRTKTEQVVFLFFSQKQARDTLNFEIVDYYLVQPDEFNVKSEYHVEVSEETQARVIKMAWNNQLALGEIHSHPNSREQVAFSYSDLEGFNEFVPHVWWRLKKKPYLAFVFGKHDFDALAWISNPDNPVGIDLFIIGEKKHIPTGNTIGYLQEKNQREKIHYSRQISFFGEEGQQKIKNTIVTVVGLGGLGSHVVQQLAYLGVQCYSLIDLDKVDLSNLNRLIGATSKDLEMKKVDVQSRQIKEIVKDVKINKIDKSLFSETAFDAVRKSDFIFGCVDNDAARLVLLELCCTYKKPYLDLATEIPDKTSFGGRMIFTGLGEGCIMCRGELDQEEIRKIFATEEERKVNEQIYGVDRTELAEGSPSVVMINGIVASIGLTEFVCYITGVRKPRPYLVYRGQMGTVNISQDPPTPNCYYCDGIFNDRERTNVLRYIQREKKVYK